MWRATKSTIQGFFRGVRRIAARTFGLASRHVIVLLATISCLLALTAILSANVVARTSYSISEFHEQSDSQRRASVTREADGRIAEAHLDPPLRVGTCVADTLHVSLPEYAESDTPITLGLAARQGLGRPESPCIASAEMYGDPSDQDILVTNSEQRVDLADGASWSVLSRSPGLHRLIVDVKPATDCLGSCSGAGSVVFDIVFAPNGELTRIVAVVEALAFDSSIELEAQRPIKAGVPTAVDAAVVFPPDAQLAPSDQIGVSASSPEPELVVLGGGGTETLNREDRQNEISVEKAKWTITSEDLATRRTIDFELILTANSADDFDAPLGLGVGTRYREYSIVAYRSGAFRVDVAEVGWIKRNIAANVDWMSAAGSLFSMCLAGFLGVKAWLARRSRALTDEAATDEEAHGYL
jgi:hypothetical protein